MSDHIFCSVVWLQIRKGFGYLSVLLNVCYDFGGFVSFGLDMKKKKKKEVSHLWVILEPYISRAFLLIRHVELRFAKLQTTGWHNSGFYKQIKS